MKFVPMRFLALLTAILVLSSCTGKVCTRQVEQTCAVYTSVKSIVMGVITSAEGILSGGDNVEGDLDEVQKPVTKQLKYKNQEGVVEVVMKVDDKGNWKVVNMAATNEELAKYVLTKLKDYNQTAHKAVGQVVKYRFVFKKQV